MLRVTYATLSLHESIEIFPSCFENLVRLICQLTGLASHWRRFLSTKHRAWRISHNGYTCVVDRLVRSGSICFHSFRCPISTLLCTQHDGVNGCKKPMLMSIDGCPSLFKTSSRISSYCSAEGQTNNQTIFHCSDFRLLVWRTYKFTSFASIIFEHKIVACVIRTPSSRSLQDGDYCYLRKA